MCGETPAPHPILELGAESALGAEQKSLRFFLTPGNSPILTLITGKIAQIPQVTGLSPQD